MCHARFTVCLVIYDIVWVMGGCGCYGVLGAVQGHSHVKLRFCWVELWFSWSLHKVCIQFVEIVGGRLWNAW